MSASVELIEVEESLILNARKKTVFRQADSVDGDAAFFISRNFHEEIAMMNDAVAIARATYEAYVTKDRAAIEALLAQDFHFTSPLDNRSIARRTSPVACRTAPRSLHSISFTSLRMESGSSSPTRAAVRPDTASAILKLSPSAAAKLSMSKCILAGQCRTRRPSVDLSTKNRQCRLFAKNPP